jgi:hypothetical protein
MKLEGVGKYVAGKDVFYAKTKKKGGGGGRHYTAS